MKKVFVKAKGNLVVRHPENYKRLKEEGEEVPLDSYWIRRIRSGDVIEVVKEEGNKKINKKNKDKER